MQRTPRTKAGNIYKQRLQEIQMEAPRLKKSKSKPKTAVSASASIDRPKRTVRRASNSGSSKIRTESEDSFEYDLDLDDGDTDSVPNNDDDDSFDAGGPSSKSRRRSGNSAAKAGMRVRKDLLKKYKCPHCKATFAEERYVAFHCKQVHKDLYEERVKAATKSEWIGHVAVGDDEEDHGSESEQPMNEDSLLEKSEPAVETPRILVPKVEEEPEKVDNYYDVRGDGNLVMYTCHLCVGFEVASKDMIKEHVEQHLAIRANFACPYCSFKGNNRASLEVHIFNHTGVKPFCCKVCNLSFKCMDDMLNHCNSGHTQCEILEETNTEELAQKSMPKLRRVRTTDVLLGHTSSHQCPYCAEQFMSVVNLKTHINTHRIKGTTIDKDWSPDDVEETEGDFTVSQSQSNTSNSPLRPKRSQINSRQLPLSKAKKLKEGAVTEHNTVLTDGPPRCQICSKVFLYTTQIERHMRDVHQLPRLPSPGKSEPESLGTTTTSLHENFAPVITSVVSRAEMPSVAVTGSPNEKVAKHTLPASPQASSVVTATAAETKSSLPVKSVFLLFDPANNKCYPVETKPVSKPHCIGPNADDTMTVDLEVEEVVSADSEKPDDSPKSLDESTLDWELDEELKHFGKPGAPLIQGADNQDLLYKCSVCDETIIGYLEIVKHLHTHSAGVECHLCAKVLSSKASLSQHFLTHVGITFSCPLCPRKLAKKQTLLEHIRIHRRELRKVCRFCQKAFINNSSLNRHLMAVHGKQEQANGAANTDKKFPCPHCPRIMYEQEEYNKHLRAHEIIKNNASVPTPSVSSMVPVKCKYCDKLWASTHGLVRHLKMAHAQALGYKPASGSSIPKSYPVPAQSTTEAFVSELPLPILTSISFEIEKAKPIEVIDLSDDEGQESGNQSQPVPVPVAAMPLGTIVNVDGQDVNAIEVLTTDVLNNTPMLEEPISPSSVVETEVVITEGECEDSTVVPLTLPEEVTNQIENEFMTEASSDLAPDIMDLLDGGGEILLDAPSIFDSVDT